MNMCSFIQIKKDKFIKELMDIEIDSENKDNCSKNY